MATQQHQNPHQGEEYSRRTTAKYHDMNTRGFKFSFKVTPGADRRFILRRSLGALIKQADAEVNRRRDGEESDDSHADER